MNLLGDEQRASLESAAETYASHLEEALPYLETRGIGRDIALSVRLGFVKSPTTPEHRAMTGRLAIPYITPAGVVGMTFRCIESHTCKGIENHSKYKKAHGQLTTLYNVWDLHGTHRDIHVAEGEIDSLTLSKMCGLPSIGIAGATNWKPFWREVLSDFRHVYVYHDGDAAGEQFGRKVQKEVGRSVVLVPLPAGEDVNSMYLKYGPDRLREMIK
jgi:DNA primase